MIHRNLKKMLNDACKGRKESHVAKEMGLSPGQLNGYRSGVNFPRGDVLQRIVNYCGVPFTITPEKK